MYKYPSQIQPPSTISPERRARVNVENLFTVYISKFLIFVYCIMGNDTLQLLQNKRAKTEHILYKVSACSY